MRLLILRLEGPMQSWGERSKWDDRDTADMPTKSGVIGLIACCMGLERANPEIVSLHRHLTVSIRADRPGKRAIDFQTIRQTRLMTADGGYRPRSTSTILSNRQYLQDAVFLCVVACDNDALCDRISGALRHPTWVPYLGRKCCTPTCPILAADTDEFADVEDALRRFPLLPRADQTQEAILAQAEDAAGIHVRSDSLVDSESRLFSARRVRYVTLPKGEWNCVPFPPVS